jgi:polyisoprenyl-phosphate glycosyltransferase
MPDIQYEHIFIDNCSCDGSDVELRNIAREDDRVRVIINRRNFGHIRSPFHGLLEARGDAVIVLPSDLQVPPSVISRLVSRWEANSLVVLLQRSSDRGSFFGFLLRRLYYRAISRLSEIPLYENVPGYGLFDRVVIEAIRQVGDPYPYLRGLVSDLGFPVVLEPYVQERRLHGKSSNNLFTLYDLGMLAITSHSKVPLRLATMMGFGASAVSFLVGLAYLIYKLVFWDRFALGIAPVVIGLFFFASVQLFFIGIIGEYIGSIHTRVTKRPLVVERERINF